MTATRRNGPHRHCGPMIILLLLLNNDDTASAFHHNHCTRKVRPQFQFDDCYLPPLDTSLSFSSASFLMSHDAATGYVKPASLSPSGITWQYTKNQVGSAYQQLDDGARALDLRPKLLANGTVIFQHGSINIPVLFESLVEDAMKWCADNPDELVLLLPSDFAYQSTTTTYNNDDFYGQDQDADIVSAMADVYQNFGVPYFHCTEVYAMSIAEILEAAELPTGGYLVALDGQDYYGTPCAKPNWVESQLVACYSTYNNQSLACTSRRQNTAKLDALKSYMLASANNEPTDDRSVLGPPANLYNFPLSQIQALWQVTAVSAVAGTSRASSILNDNKKSHLNEELVDMVYQGQFDAISVLTVDNVALHGNALLSVLRSTCGQSSELSSSNACGDQIPKPNMSYFHLSKLGFAMLLTVYVMILLWIGATIAVAVQDREENPHPRLLYTIFQRISDKIYPQSTNGNPSTKEELLH